MKGMIFTHFIELVEDKFGFEMADDIIESANLLSGGAYTSIGTYDHTELLELIKHLSEATGVPAEDLIQVFTEHLFEAFVKDYPKFFEAVDNCFDFLNSIEDTVHVEVKKLYPDAELPTFEPNIESDSKMTLIYTSKRPFSAVAYGLIKGSASYYKEHITIELEDLSTPKLTRVVFTLNKH